MRIATTVDKTTKKLANLPPMVDEEKKWAIYLLDRLASYAYIADPGLLPFAILKGLDWTLKYGRTSMTSPILATIALIMAGSFGDFAGGKKYADLAIKFMNSSVESRTLFLCNHFVLHYQVPVDSCIMSLTRGYESGMRSGDLESAFWGAYCSLEAKLHMGSSLPELLEECEKFSRRTANHKQEMIGWSLRPVWQLAANLAGSTPDIMDETEYKKQIEEHAHFQRQVARLNTSAAFWFDDHELVVQLMEENDYHGFSIEKAAPGANGTGALYFHCAMSCIALAHEDKPRHVSVFEPCSHFFCSKRTFATYDVGC